MYVCGCVGVGWWVGVSVCGCMCVGVCVSWEKCSTWSCTVYSRCDVGEMNEWL